MVNMITLNSREEWLEKRKSYIGGSEASCIVGMNPYATNVELWEMKTGRRKAEDISEKSYVKYGTEVVLAGKSGDNFISFSELAKNVGTINYEVLCGVGKRLVKVYYDNGKFKGTVNYLEKL